MCCVHIAGAGNTGIVEHGGNREDLASVVEKSHENDAVEPGTPVGIDVDTAVTTGDPVIVFRPR